MAFEVPVESGALHPGSFAEILLVHTALDHFEANLQNQGSSQLHFVGIHPLSVTAGQLVAAERISSGHSNPPKPCYVPVMTKTLPGADQQPPGPVRQAPGFAGWQAGEGMNKLQRSFYDEVFVPSVNAGNPVDVQRQHGYAETLIGEIVGDAERDPAGTRLRLEALVQAYSGRYLPSTAGEVLADLCFRDGDFAAGYAALGGGVPLSFHLSIAGHLGHPPLTAEQVMNWADWRLTKKGILDLDNVFLALQDRLDAFQAAHGVSIVTDFWRRLNAPGSVDEVAAGVENEVNRIYSGEEVRWFLARSNEPPTPDEVSRAIAFPGASSINWPVEWVDSTRHHVLLGVWLKGLVRQAENDARDKAGTPRIGEQWKSEMGLLKELRAELPEETLVHQHRPYWLAPMSLDIFLPAHNIAVEYQGAQHSAPVDFFGGKDRFEIQQDRDIQKRLLCEDNGCILIEVHPGYSLDAVADNVRAAIRVRRQAAAEAGN